MNERDKLIAALIKEKGGTKEQYLRLMDSIAYHESAGTLDPSIKQYGGGPGRGVYQFEVGKNAGAITAARRTKQYYEDLGQPIPEWLINATQNNSLDASTLNRDQQDILFLANMRKHPKANFSNVWDGKETIADFWANYHWAGDQSERKTKLNSFNESYKQYENLYDNKDESIQHVPEKKSQFETLDTVLNRNKLLYGGLLPKGSDKEINSFNTGGLHETNPLGGIPMGIGDNGKQNTVEEGEASYNFKEGKFIFSNRIDFSNLLLNKK